MSFMITAGAVVLLSLTYGVLAMVQQSRAEEATVFYVVAMICLVAAHYIERRVRD